MTCDHSGYEISTLPTFSFTSGPYSAGSRPANWPVRKAVVRSSPMPGHTVSTIRFSAEFHIGTMCTGFLNGSSLRARQ